MKTVSMSGALRAHVGKKDAKGHRKEGKVPCVLYGGDEQIHFTLDEKAFIKILFTPEVYIINISIDGKEHRAVLQDIQYHPVTDKVLHADFLQLVPGKPVKTALPVTIEGNAPGVMQGGKLVQKIRKLKVLGIADDLPDNLVLNIDNLNIGDSIKVKDIKMENIKFLDNPNAQVVTVKTARGAGAEEVEEEAAGAAEETAAEGAETKKEGEE
ncbi:MAG: 50S ribosomal protein L25/general stress protein Ctc [Bacteroidales bacterium]|nr:50S ribosomal protein L25/general stress protein Ctc [Bacteroidales bacterium]